MTNQGSNIWQIICNLHLISITIGTIILVVMTNLIIHFYGYEIIMYQLVKNNVKANIETVIAASKECFPNYPVLAQLTAAQAILEGGLEGSIPSLLALNYNNLFGIKGQGNGTPGSVSLLTTEYVNDRKINVYQPFAKNTDVLSSFQQHAKLLMNGTHDNPERYKNLFSAKSIEEAATLIHSDGYCTDPNYPKEILRVYNTYLKGKL